MLDCNMTSSRSPVVPMNIVNESCYLPVSSIWEHDMNPQQTKLETDILDLIDPSMMGASSPSTIHHTRNDCHFQSSPYLTALPSLGDAYCTTDCHMLDNFNAVNTMDSTFKLSEGPPPFPDTYDNFLHEFNPQHHSQGLNGHGSGGVLVSGDSHSGSPGPVHMSGPFTHHTHHTPHHAHHLSLPSSFTEDPSLNVCHPTNHHDCHNSWDDPSYDPSYDLFLRKGESPSTSDCVSYTTDIDSEMDSKSSGGSLSTEICHVSPPKRKVGRPPKKDKKLKRNEKKTGRLWEFIRDLLKNPEYCPSLVRWENPEEGHFRFVNSEKVAQLWGQIKGNPRMTYEKLSRAMRYYYKSHVFEPVLGRRLVYKFGHNATNWRPVNPNFSTVQNMYN